MARAKWLGEQLENYVERWLGFQTAFSRPRPPAGDDELFCMIEVGAELLGEELTRAGVTTDNQASWCAFLRALDGVRTEGGSELPSVLRGAVAGLRRALAGRLKGSGKEN